jgi:hypothetical protein
MIKWHIKKQSRGTKQPTIRLEGNKGGDFVEITPIEGERVYLRCGCSCVMVIDKVVPNEFLSIALNDCILQHGSIQEYLNQINYDEVYKQELVNKVK